MSTMPKSCCSCCVNLQSGQSGYSVRRLAAGFTLIELLIVVAIVAILASVAIPQYTQYLIRSRIPEATSNLAAMRTQMELNYDNTHTYIDAPVCDDDKIPTSQFFTFSCSGESTTAYTLSATGKGAMNGFTYTVNQNNTKTSSTSWGDSSVCWVMRKGGSC
jgi:type IV pilus assembly protein PilE